MGRLSKYAPEFRERAVRMVHEHAAEYPSQWAAIQSMATKLGMHGRPSATCLGRNSKRATISKPRWPESTNAPSEIPGTVQARTPPDERSLRPDHIPGCVQRSERCGEVEQEFSEAGCQWHG